MFPDVQRIEQISPELAQLFTPHITQHQFRLVCHTLCANISSRTTPPLKGVVKQKEYEEIFISALGSTNDLIRILMQEAVPVFKERTTVKKLQDGLYPLYKEFCTLP